MPEAPAPKGGAVGILLINLGTPDAPTPAAIRRYLREFLSDPRVVELPAALWQPILRLFVLTRRPAAIAPKYAQVWLERGSPLLVYGQDLAAGVQHTLQARGLPVQVALAMRYGNPGLDPALEALRAASCRRILVAPLYPQYAASTTATAVDAVNDRLARWRHQPTLRYLDRFHDAPAYLDALQAAVLGHWARAGKADRLLLSFHGLPSRPWIGAILTKTIATGPRRRCAGASEPMASGCTSPSRAASGRPHGCSRIPNPRSNPGRAKGCAAWMSCVRASSRIVLKPSKKSTWGVARPFCRPVGRTSAISPA